VVHDFACLFFCQVETYIRRLAEASISSFIYTVEVNRLSPEICECTLIAFAKFECSGIAHLVVHDFACLFFCQVETYIRRLAEASISSFIYTVEVNRLSPEICECTLIAFAKFEYSLELLILWCVVLFYGS
jgi:hypothetical protein